MTQVSIETALRLGERYIQEQNWQAAGEVYQRIAQADPSNAAAWRGLGLVAHWSGARGAIQSMRRAVELQPDWTEALNNLTALLFAGGQFDEAIDVIRRYLTRHPDDVEVLNNLGSALNKAGRVNEAAEAYRAAIAIEPGHAIALNNLGTALGQIGRTEEAIAMLRRAVAIRPDYGNAWSNLGAGLSAARHTDEALEAFERAASLKKDDPWAWNGMGNALRDLGRAQAAMECLREALRLDPTNAAVHSNIVMCWFFMEQATARDVLAEAIRYSRQHAEPITAASGSGMTAAPELLETRRGGIVEDVDNDGEASAADEGPLVIDRPLRVGYISSEFVGHPVGWFMLPLLEHHDRSVVEAVGYSNTGFKDEQTQRLKAQTALWREVVGLDDQTAARLIRQDGIDILVDLSGHTGSNQLLVMARRPAPVQVTYLWHAGTTGMSAIDWRFSDPWFDPDGVEAAYTERTIRLGSYWCYRPPIDAGDVGPLPSTAGEPITFGCLNEPGKMSDSAVTAWMRILAAVPESRLLVHAPAMGTQRRVREAMDRHGLSHERLICVGKLSLVDYFNCYRRIDIAVDPFPYCGGTTSCDAIWMGVPVVTRAGRTAVGRGGVSILNLIGHGELVSQDIDQYVSIAVSLAQDPVRLAELRHTLRGRIAGSLLMDEATHARQIERAYRRMWREWIGRRPGQS